MTKREAKGEIDLAWTSDLKDAQKNMQETVDATPKEDQGSESTEWLPDEVDAEEITETQADIIKVAVQNPTLATYDVADRVDGSRSYVGATLRSVCQNWYESVFKQHGNSKKHDPDKNNKRSIDTDTTETDTETAEQEPEDNTTDTIAHVEQACDAVIATTQNTELANFAEYVKGEL